MLATSEGGADYERAVLDSPQVSKFGRHGFLAARVHLLSGDSRAALEAGAGFSRKYSTGKKTQSGTDWKEKTHRKAMTVLSAPQAPDNTRVNVRWPLRRRPRHVDSLRRAWWVLR